MSIIQVSKQSVMGQEKAVYEAVEFIGGRQRPMVRSPDSNGRMRDLKT